MPWVRIEDVGDTEFLVDEHVDKFRLLQENERVRPPSVCRRSRLRPRDGRQGRRGVLPQKRPRPRDRRRTRTDPRADADAEDVRVVQRRRVCRAGAPTAKAGAAGRHRPGKNQCLGRCTCHHSRNIASSFGNRITYRASWPFPWLMRITIRRLSTSVGRRWTASEIRRPAA